MSRAALVDPVSLVERVRQMLSTVRNSATVLRDVAYELREAEAALERVIAAARDASR